jgi:hypothetical protein
MLLHSVCSLSVPILLPYNALYNRGPTLSYYSIAEVGLFCILYILVYVLEASILLKRSV